VNFYSKKLDAIFYRTKTGIEPVRNWLKKLSKADKKCIGEAIKTVQYGWPIGMPLVDNLGQGLWEVRIKLSQGRISRIIFFMDNKTMILVNGFFKKTKKTPQTELKLARKRKKQYESENKENNHE
jgi:phage-related protein